MQLLNKTFLRRTAGVGAFGATFGEVAQAVELEAQVLDIAKQTRGGIGAAEFAGDDLAQPAAGFVISGLGEQADLTASIISKKAASANTKAAFVF